jgi:hypothetical protein
MSPIIENVAELSQLFQRSFPEVSNINIVLNLIPSKIEKLLPHEMAALFRRLSEIPEFYALLELDCSGFRAGDRQISPGCFMNRTYNGLGALINYLATGLFCVTTSYLSCFFSSGYHSYQTLTGYESTVFKLLKILLNAAGFFIGATTSWYLSLYALPEVDLLRRAVIAVGSGSISTFVVSLGNCLFRCTTPSDNFLNIFNAIVGILNINGSVNGFENFPTIQKESILFILTQAIGEYFVLGETSVNSSQSSLRSVSLDEDSVSITIEASHRASTSYDSWLNFNMLRNFFLKPPPPSYSLPPSSSPPPSYSSCPSLFTNVYTLPPENDGERFSGALQGV